MLVAIPSPRVLAIDVGTGTQDILICEAGGVIVENLRGLEQIDWSHPLITVFPLRLTGADGSPTRAVAAGTGRRAAAQGIADAPVAAAQAAGLTVHGASPPQGLVGSLACGRSLAPFGLGCRSTEPTYGSGASAP